LRIRIDVRASSLCLVCLLTACPGSLSDPERFRPNLDAGVLPPASTGTIPEPDSGEIPDDGGPTGPCPDVPAAIFAPSCVASCHSTAGLAGNLDLSGPDVGARLLNKPAFGNANLLLIHASAPENSVLYTKLTPTPPYGSRMPAADVPLEPHSIGCVLEWIQNVVAQSSDAGADGSADATAD